jgi:NAD(P)-dependent dehydrogenase (short-subunit alcohol dehydrogenase family)
VRSADRWNLIALAGGAAAVALWQVIRPRFSFDGRVVVITGGSRGLGLAIARELAKENARLVLLARDESELERARADLSGRGAEVLTLRCDVTRRDDVEEAIENVLAQFGRIDALINNAGEIVVGPLAHMTMADFEKAMAVHGFASLYTVFAVLPHMRRNGGGRIVNISSIGGKIAIPHLAPYCMSKFALTGLSDALRAELAKDRIFVTTVCPGLMRTGSHMNAMFKGQREKEFTWFALSAGCPLFSINASRAARQIVQACRRGRPQLIITIQARLLVLANALAPGLLARVFALANRVLPAPAGAASDAAKPGWHCQSRWAPSAATYLNDRATERLNGVRRPI